MKSDLTLAEPSPEADRAAFCGGKERFASPGLAWRVARRRKYRGAEVYRCAACNGFHIGRHHSTRGR